MMNIGLTVGKEHRKVGKVTFFLIFSYSKQPRGKAKFKKKKRKKERKRKIFSPNQSFGVVSRLFVSVLQYIQLHSDDLALLSPTMFPLQK